MRTLKSHLHESNDIALPRECQVGVPHVLVVLSTLSILWELSALLVLDTTEQYRYTLLPSSVFPRAFATCEIVKSSKAY